MESRFPFNKWEDREAEEAVKRPSGPRVLARSPKGAFWSGLGCCSKCNTIESVDAYLNGHPGVLEAETFGRLRRSRGFLAWTQGKKPEGHFYHEGCGGVITIYGKLPKGYRLV